MSHASTETKEEEALKRLCIIFGVSSDNLTDLLLLSRAIEYANIDWFIRDGDESSGIERIKNEIFFIKATSYFRRKKINPLILGNIDIIRSIQNSEYQYVTLLKMKLIYS